MTEPSTPGFTAGHFGTFAIVVHRERDGTAEQWLHWHCPGCGGGHGIPITGPKRWHFDGNMQRPSVTPSVLVRGPSPVCHCFIRDGSIEFCSDSAHALAGRTVALPPLDA